MGSARIRRSTHHRHPKRRTSRCSFTSATNLFTLCLFRFHCLDSERGIVFCICYEIKEMEIALCSKLYSIENNDEWTKIPTTWLNTHSTSNKSWSRNYANSSICVWDNNNELDENEPIFFNWIHTKLHATNGGSVIFRYWLKKCSGKWMGKTATANLCWVGFLWKRIFCSAGMESGCPSLGRSGCISYLFGFIRDDGKRIEFNA